jgi:hypothetical protein
MSLILGVCCASNAFAAPIVRFTQSNYVINSTTERFRVDVVIDADDSTPIIEPLSVGLLSMGMSLKFDPTQAQVLLADDIAIAPPLNYDGLGNSPGVKSIGLSTATVRGFVPILDPAYTGSALASFWVTSRTGGPYTLSLQLDNSVTTESLFVNENGDTLDGSLKFGTASVQAIPEPTGAAVLAVAGGAMLGRRRR